MNDFVIENGVLKKYTGKGGDVVIPEGVTRIGQRAFSGCISLTSVTIPEGVTEIGNEAFYYCIKLTSVFISEGVAKIGYEAFYECRSLTSIVIPESVTAIGESAFYNCKNLTNVIIPEGVQYIGERAFEECYGMRDEQGFVIVCGVLFGFTDPGTHKAVIPDGVTKISKGAFKFDPKVKFLSIPASLKSIHPESFDYHFIGDRMEIQDTECPIEELMDALDKEQVANMYLTGKAVLGVNTEKYIVSYIKRKKREYAQKYIKLNDASFMTKFLNLWKKVSLEDLNSYIEIANNSKKATITALLLEYKNKTYSQDKVEKAEQDKIDKALGVKELSLSDWRKVFNIKTNGEKTVITGYKGSETDVVIPMMVGKRSITEIGESAFKNIKHIKSVTIPEGVKKIGGFAFMNCRDLTEIIIPESVEEIGFGAFSGCHGFKDDQGFIIIRGVLYDYVDRKSAKAVIPEGVFKISSGAFKNCSNLTEVIIPNSVTEIPSYAFNGCSNLKSIVIPESVTEIALGAFFRCLNRSIHAPVGSYAEKYAKEHNIPFEAI